MFTGSVPISGGWKLGNRFGARLKMDRRKRKAAARPPEVDPGEEKAAAGSQ